LVLKINPNGIASLSPRLPYSATLGRGIALGPNPEGVAALALRIVSNETRRGCVSATIGHNFFRVGTNYRLGLAAAPSPRVAEYGNPGLKDETPFGVATNDRLGNNLLDYLRDQTNE
jgi:hypothetical protein